MTGPEHYARAEDMAEHAEGLITGDDPDGLAPAWAAVAQVHATLALAAASAVSSPADDRAWADVADTRLSDST
jgi:hypothetical protein